MSMTQEQALKLLEHPIYKWSMDWDEREDGLNYTEAIEIAIAALRPVSREQVERMAGEWVQDINKGPAVFYCSSCGESFEIHSYEFQKYRFCPFCMAPMTDEAVEMVMERLEALKDGSTTD